ncbi:hypothetical protein REPUB_Repub05bG0065700 [Reevesia pubescens]
MPHIANPKFHILDIIGKNYSSWSLDVELHFQGEGLFDSLKETKKKMIKIRQMH